MDRSTFESADLILDEMAVTLDELLDFDQFAAVRFLLARLSETVGPLYSVNLLWAVGLQARSPVLLGVRGDFGSRGQAASRHRCLSLL